MDWFLQVRSVSFLPQVLDVWKNSMTNPSHPWVFFCGKIYGFNFSSTGCSSFLFYPSVYLSIYPSIHPFIYCSRGVLTQGLALARQVLIHLSDIPVFCFRYFLDMVSCFCLGPASHCDPPTYAFHIAGTIGSATMS
jgi:hypothetical protein